MVIRYSKGKQQGRFPKMKIIKQIEKNEITMFKNTVVVVRHSNKILKIVVTDLKILKIDVSAKIL